MVSEQSFLQYIELRNQMIGVLFTSSANEKPTENSNRTFYIDSKGLHVFTRANGRTESVLLSMEDTYEAFEPILRNVAVSFAISFIGAGHPSIVGEFPNITTEYNRIKDIGNISTEKFLLHAAQRAYARKISEHIRQNSDLYMDLLIENMQNALLRYRD